LPLSEIDFEFKTVSAYSGMGKPSAKSEPGSRPDTDARQ
jgi:hypothetical protein